MSERATSTPMTSYVSAQIEATVRAFSLSFVAAYPTTLRDARGPTALARSVFEGLLEHFHQIDDNTTMR